MCQTPFHRVFLAIAVLVLAGTARADDDSLARVREEMRASPPSTTDAYRVYFDRLGRIRGEEARAERLILLDAYLAGPGADDDAARASAEHVSFRRLERQVSPDPAAALDDLIEPGRRLELVEAIPVFREERWLTEAEEVADALDALRRLDRETRTRAGDPVFRLGIRAAANLAEDPELGRYVRATRWSPPWLIVAIGEPSPTPYELLTSSIAARAEAVRRWTDYETSAQPLLDEYEGLLTHLTREFAVRFGEHLRLRPLASPFGGAADDPPELRSFPDGVAIPVIVFPSAASFRAYEWDMGGSGSTPYLDLTAGRVFVHAHPEERRAQEQEVLLQNATKALVFWSCRQRSHWRFPDGMKYWLPQGFARWMSGVRREGDRLRFTGVPAALLEDAQETARALRKASEVPTDEMLEPETAPYPVYPLEKLTSFVSASAASEWAASRWSLLDVPARDLYFTQAWALVLFLYEFEDGKYRGRLYDVVDLYLDRVPPVTAFRQAMFLRDEDDWISLDEQFQKFVREDFLRRDPAAYAAGLPPRAR